MADKMAPDLIVRGILDDCFPYIGKKDRRDEATSRIVDALKADKARLDRPDREIARTIVRKHLAKRDDGLYGDYNEEMFLDQILSLIDPEAIREEMRLFMVEQHDIECALCKANQDDKEKAIKRQVAEEIGKLEARVSWLEEQFKAWRDA